MKKRFSRLLAVCILTMLLLLPARAYALGVTLTGGTSGLRPGSTVTLTLSASGSNLVAINGSFSGIQGMSLSGVTSARSGWQVSVNGNNFTAYDSNMTNPVGSSAAVLTATFKVNSGAASGSTLAAAVSGVTASDGTKTVSLGSSSWSATVAAPLSGNNDLASLSCSNASLTPAFSAGTTYYSVTVPYSVTALSINYTKADGTASVAVSGNSLVVGSNTITVTVTAQNGAKKSYYITATRQQDPNYEPSTNALLQSLTPDSGVLSPAFDPNVTEYVIYLPYEAESFSLSGVAQDGKARSVTDDSAALKEGDNVLAVTCTAEDGETVMTYTVHVYRMPLYEGELPEIIAPDTEPELEPEPEPESEPTLWEQSLALAQTSVVIPFVSDYAGALPLWGLAAGGLLLLVLLFYLLGTLVGKAAGKRKMLRRLQSATDSSDGFIERLQNDAAKPVEETLPEPPAEKVAPTVEENDPPAEEVEPTAEEVDPPAEEVEPPAEEVEPPAEEVEPPAIGSAPTDEPERAEADDPMDAILLDELLNDIKNM